MCYVRRAEPRCVFRGALLPSPLFRPGSIRFGSSGRSVGRSCGCSVDRADIRSVVGSVRFVRSVGRVDVSVDRANVRSIVQSADRSVRLFSVGSAFRSGVGWPVVHTIGRSVGWSVRQSDCLRSIGRSPDSSVVSVSRWVGCSLCFLLSRFRANWSSSSSSSSSVAFFFLFIS